MTAKETDIEALIRGRLAPLAAQSVEIHDESHEHAGHAGARESGGGHFQLIVIASAFSGKSPVARHRMVYENLSDLIPTRIHALAIRTYTPDEIAKPAKG